MARIPSRDFNPSIPVVVRRFFVAAGRHWNPGDIFDWPRLSVAQRRVRQLFDAGKLAHEGETAVAQPQHESVVPPMTPAPVIETEVEDHAIFTAAPEPTPSSEPSTPTDDLDDLDMKALRAIAEDIGAPSRVSREEQRKAIRETRNERQD